MANFEMTSLFACLPRTERGVPIVLNADPKGKNFLYANGNSIIIRNVENPSLCDMYTEHAKPTTVASYSPSGYYIASGDVGGKIRIWDTVNKEHILKYEYQPISGAVKDISWTEDSKRLAVVGEGRERFGAAIMWDTGTSCGEIFGQSKKINSCAFRQQRPFRLVTASEDYSVGYFESIPVKHKMNLSNHTNFVNCVRYHPQGDVFISGGADGIVCVFDGKDATFRDILGGEKTHSFGVYGMSFSPDGSRVLTVSADKTAKIWDLETSQCVTVFTLGTQIEDMQIGCLWMGPHVLSVSLSGYINYLDPDRPQTPRQVVRGHNKNITALALSDNRATAFTGSFDGRVCAWNLASGHVDAMQGTAHSGHTSQVQDMSVCEGALFSVGIDDTIQLADAAQRRYQAKMGLTSQPRAVALGKGGLVVVACIAEVVVLRDTQVVLSDQHEDTGVRHNVQVVYSEKVAYEPLSVALHPGQTELAVGGSDFKIHIYSLDNDCLTEKHVLGNSQGSINHLRYSPSGAHLAAADSNKHVILLDLPDYTSERSAGYGFHQASVKCVEWSPDERRLATGSLDTNVLIWDVTDMNNPRKIQAAHPQSQVTKLAWQDAHTLLTVGQDASVRLWRV